MEEEDEDALGGVGVGSKQKGPEIRQPLGKRDR